jgi:hypothetical protein
MDGVKISVSKDGEEGAAKRKGRPKKAAKPAAAESRTESQSAPSTPEKKSRKASKGGFMSTLVTVIVTAIVAGGAIYAWQHKSSQKGLNQVSEDAKRVRADFEQRMDQLKNKLTGVETENQKLKDTAKELEEYMALLKGAKLDFSDKETGVSFEYPAILGEAKVEIVKGTSGYLYKGSFSRNDKLVFGGVSADFVAAASTTTISLMESQGFIEQEGKYYLQPAGKTDALDYPFTPSKKVSDKVLLIDKNSFAPASASSTASIDLGENIGAVVKTDSDKIRGIAFLDQDLSLMPLENLEIILRSVTVKK